MCYKYSYALSMRNKNVAAFFCAKNIVSSIHDPKCSQMAFFINMFIKKELRRWKDNDIAWLFHTVIAQLLSGDLPYLWDLEHTDCILCQEVRSPSIKNDLDMTLSWTQCRNTNSGDLGNVEPFLRCYYSQVHSESSGSTCEGPIYRSNRTVWKSFAISKY